MPQWRSKAAVMMKKYSFEAAAARDMREAEQT
jgi:hypothetical protein